MGPNRRRMQPVDLVALLLAAALTGMVWLILLVTAVQIVSSDASTVELSDNATQVLVGAIGALTGLLGGYMGSRRPAARRELPGNDIAPPA